LNEELCQLFAELFPTSEKVEAFLANVLSQVPDIPPGIPIADWWLSLGGRLSDDDAIRIIAAARVIYPGDERLATLGNVGAPTTTRHEPNPLSQIFVEFPDGRRFRIGDVPATTPIGDLAAEIIEQYPAATERSVVIDRIESDGTGRRLNPDETLEEAGISDAEQLRVGFQATAGAGLFGSRLTARSLAREQVLAFAEHTPGFTLDSLDDPDFPSRFVISFRAYGFGPPHNELILPLNPTIQDEHTVQIALMPDYPVVPPIVTWLTPLFHPNILDGTVCLPVEGGDLYAVCRAIIDMAAYKIYEVRPKEFGGGGFLNLAAAAWALSAEGQRRIIARGGTARTLLSRTRIPLDIQLISDPSTSRPSGGSARHRPATHFKAGDIIIRFDESVSFDFYGSGTAEEGGFLLGNLNETENGCQIEITDVVRATASRATHSSWTITADSVSELRAGIGNRLLVGWFHTHPEGAPVYPSKEDMALHRVLFPQPWQIAMVLSPDAVTCYCREGDLFLPVKQAGLARR
jgi:proteasome lid subunit RPN8/RPN11